jgi:hypothetical protein
MMLKYVDKSLKRSTPPFFEDETQKSITNVVDLEVKYYYMVMGPHGGDSVVGIATGYGLDARGVLVRVPVGSRILSSPSCLNWLWDQTNLLSNGYRGLFFRR